MAKIYISIGSNIEKEKYVPLSIIALRHTFGELDVSSLYLCEAVGFNGPKFYNLVVGADTSMSLNEVVQCLKEIEYAHGRSPTAKKFEPRTLDLDLLLYDDVICDEPAQLPRQEITENAFVLWPLAEIAGAKIHPLLGESYQKIWQHFDKRSQQITQLPLFKELNL